MTDQEKIIYDILCSDEQPPEGQHWEGFVTNKIVAALAQPEPQEKISIWIKANTEHKQWYICPKCSFQAPRFRDEWVGLTDEEIRDLYAAHDATQLNYAWAIEAKLKEKNHG